MNDPIVFLNDIQSSFKKTKVITMASVIAMVTIVLGCVYFAFDFVNSMQSKIFVVDQGYVLQATRQDNMVQRDLEVVDHVRRFHELMYNLAPNRETIQMNVDMAANLGIDVAYKIDNDREEEKFYSQMIQLGGVEEIHIPVDGIEVDITTYPYIARTKAIIYFVRQSNVAKYDFESVCSLVNTPRSAANPHGLKIEKYLLVKQDLIKTDTR